MTNDMSGPLDDAASWATRLDDVQAVRELVRAAASALRTLEYGRRFVNPEEIGTHLDLARIEGDLRKALAAVGHPAADSAAPSPVQGLPECVPE